MIDTRLITAYLQQLERKACNITQVTESITHTQAGFAFKLANKYGQSYKLEFYYTYKDISNSKTVCTVKLLDDSISHVVKFVDNITTANINNLKHAAELLTEYASYVISTAAQMLTEKFNNTLDTTNDDVSVEIKDFVKKPSNTEIDGKIVGGLGVSSAAKHTDLLFEEFGGIAAAHLYRKIFNVIIFNSHINSVNETIVMNSYEIKHKIEKITKHYCSTGAAYLAYQCMNSSHNEQNDKVTIEGPNVEFPMHIFVYDVLNVAATNSKN